MDGGISSRAEHLGLHAVEGVGAGGHAGLPAVHPAASRDRPFADRLRDARGVAGMVYRAVCSGIEAATVAWHPLGWRAAWYAEIDRFASAVLAHRYPEVRNFGDFTQIDDAAAGAIDVLVGGTPCQSFSLRS